MLKQIFWPALFGLLVGLLIVGNLKPDQSGRISSFAAAVEAASPAVVNIHSLRERELGRREQLLQLLQPGELRQRYDKSLGSGVIMREDGYIVTNHHVIKDATYINVLLADGRSAMAEVVGSDSESDLAVLKIPAQDLPTVAFGNSENLRVGDIVLAIGNPFDIGQSVSQGIVGAIGRYGIGVDAAFQDFIQTDASINPGNSGGALVDVNGRLMGINSVILSSSSGSQGVGLAIPTDAVVSVVDDIIQHGHVMRGWLGINVADSPRGIFVTAVAASSPAELGGMQAGDELLSIDGEAVVEGYRAMTDIAMRKPGSEVQITVGRGGAEALLTVSVGLRPTRQSG